MKRNFHLLRLSVSPFEICSGYARQTRSLCECLETCFFEVKPMSENVLTSIVPYLAQFFLPDYTESRFMWTNRFCATYGKHFSLGKQHLRQAGFEFFLLPPVPHHRCRQTESGCRACRDTRPSASNANAIRSRRRKL